MIGGLGGELTCEQDRAATRLTCIQCGSPICPQCMVRTPVGLKCTTCGAGGGAERSRRPQWVVPALIGLVLLAAVGLARLLSGDSDPGNSAIEEGLATPAAEGPARFALIGEEARDGNLAFVVSAFECGATEVGAGAGLRAAQGRYCFLSVTLRNVGRSPVQVFGPGQALLDDQGRRYGLDERATAAHPANAGRDPVTSLINPSNELPAVFVFDIPPGVDPLTAHLRASQRGRGAVVRLAARL